MTLVYSLVPGCSAGSSPSRCPADLKERHVTKRCTGQPHQGHAEKKNIGSKSRPGAALPAHVGFSSSQFPDEAHWRRWGPTSSNPSAQANAQLVFHGKLPGLWSHSTDPWAGLVKASHSTTGDGKEHRGFKRRIHALPVEFEFTTEQGGCLSRVDPNACRSFLGTCTSTVNLLGSFN